MSLEGSLDVSVDDDSVEFEFSVYNAGGDDVTLRFPDAQTHDVIVTDADDGDEVWRVSEGVMFAQVLSEETLEAGERETFEATWDRPVEGEYDARGTLTATNVDCEATTAFSI